MISFPVADALDQVSRGVGAPPAAKKRWDKQA